jgi:hypothetical protein
MDGADQAKKLAGNSLQGKRDADQGRSLGSDRQVEARKAEAHLRERGIQG